MKKNNYCVFLVSIACFFMVSIFTSSALSYDKEDFLTYLINKTNPELNVKNKGDDKIPQNTKKNTKNEEYIKISLENEDNVQINDVIKQDVEKEQVAPKPKETPVQNIELAKGKPQILIYHTHGTESYEPESVGNYHSLNRSYSVMAVGEELKKELSQKGYNVVHNTDYHDYPSFNGSYTRSLSTAREILKKNPSINVVFDIHRDGVELKNDEVKLNSRKSHLVKIDGENVAKFSIVVGPESPNRDKVESFARYITDTANDMYPGLAKGVIVKPYGKFNTFLSNNYALIEIGSNATEIDESIRTSKYLANVLDKALKSLK